MIRANIIRRIVKRDVGNLELAADKVQQDDAELYQAACDHFGTWETALQYADAQSRRWPVTKRSSASGRFADISTALRHT